MVTIGVKITKNMTPHNKNTIPPAIRENPHYNPYYQHKLKMLRETRLDATFFKLPKQPIIGEFYKFTGRVSYKRNLGAIIFMHVTTEVGTLQLLFNHQTTQQYVAVKRITRGDIIYVEGPGGLSKTNHFSIFVTRCRLVSPTYAELPDKFAGLTDGAISHDQRYLTLLTNSSIRGAIHMRMKLLQAIRRFFYEKNVAEIDINTLGTTYGGAVAKPFLTRLNASKKDLYLSIAPQLRLKELIFAGYPAIFTLTHNFRNEGIDSTHQPEFAAVEVYIENRDYHHMIALFESLVRYVVEQCKLRLQLTYKDRKINLGKWEKVDYCKLLKDRLNVTPASSYTQLTSLLKAQKLPVYATSEQCCYQLFDKLIAPTLINPTCVINYPALSTPLAKRVPNRPGYCEQCEIYIGGIEIANIYSEENDPVQLGNSITDFKSYAINQGAAILNDQFIKMLGYGMPQAGGLGFGIDRLLMLLTGMNKIDEVIPFPL